MKSKMPIRRLAQGRGIKKSTMRCSPSLLPADFRTRFCHVSQVWVVPEDFCLVREALPSNLLSKVLQYIIFDILDSCRMLPFCVDKNRLKRDL